MGKNIKLHIYAMIEHIEQGTLPSHVKAVIALTSWKKRINTVGLTIFNLMCVCGPEFHIVLTLSEDEFPEKEMELPHDLIVMNLAGVFEILWVKNNWRSFKKWIFCSLRYPTVPIITADDDCLYKFNYANELLSHISSHGTCVTYWCDRFKRTRCYNTAGYATCYPPGYFRNVENYMTTDMLDEYDEDDMLYVALRYIQNITGCVCLNRSYEEIAVPHDEIDPLHDIYKGRTRDERDRMITDLISMLEEH